jgi:hypothetical protein
MGISTATHSCAKLNNNRKVRRQNKRRGCGLKIKSNKKFMKRGELLLFIFTYGLGEKTSSYSFCSCLLRSKPLSRGQPLKNVMAKVMCCLLCHEDFLLKI